jgi:hypothetical protein
LVLFTILVYFPDDVRDMILVLRQCIHEMNIECVIRKSFVSLSEDSSIILQTLGYVQF